MKNPQWIQLSFLISKQRKRWTVLQLFFSEVLLNILICQRNNGKF